VVINVARQKHQLTRCRFGNGLGTLDDEKASADLKSVVAGGNFAALFDAVAGLDFNFLQAGVDDL
jgi:hypothetical protein